MTYIKDYREGDYFKGTYLCKSKAVLETKAGKPYYSVSLQDMSGSVDGKIWEINSGIDEFEAGDFIHCEGQVTIYQGNMQIRINRVRVSDESEYDIADYIPTTKKDIEAMFNKLLEYIKSINNIHFRTLLESFFVEDVEFVKEFKKHSAAKSVHHAFMGGLLEHTLSVTNLCQYYSENYPKLNRDLLITAAIFHDIGKVTELGTFPENDYSDEGQLLGHIYSGTRLVENAIEKIKDFPQIQKRELLHCMLAHHGKLEFGSPKVPELIEAMALHMADNTDAKLETMTEIFENAGDNYEWLGYNRFLDSNLRQTSGEK